jgi:hypothetical protein
MNKMFNKKGQNALEYTLLIITVAGAFMAMNVYIRRAVNARLHNVELEVSPPVIIQQNSTTNST